MKKRSGNSYAHRIFKKLNKLFPLIMSKEHTYEHYESGIEFRLPFFIEWDNDELMFGYTFRMAGDLCHDPLIKISVDFDEGAVACLRYEDMGGNRWKLVETHIDEYGDLHIMYTDQYDMPVARLDGINILRTVNRYIFDLLQRFDEEEYTLTSAAVQHCFDGECADVILEYKGGETTKIKSYYSNAIAEDYARQKGLTHLL